MFDNYLIIKIISVLIASFSQILLKQSAMKQYKNSFYEYFNWRVILAYSLFFGSLILGIYALKGLSVSMSAIIESLSYLLIPVLCFIFLNEKINYKQIIGIVIIMIGIVIYCV